MNARSVVSLPTPPRWKDYPKVGTALLALSAGAGELYVWPRLHAIAGFDVVWLLLPASLITLPILIECQRIAVTTGGSFFLPLLRASRLLAIVTIVIVLASFFWLGGWISGAAYGMSLLFDFPHCSQKTNTVFWSFILMALSIIPVVTGREEIRKHLQKTLNWFALLTFGLCIVVVAIDTQHWSMLPRFLKAMLIPHAFPIETLGKNTDDLIVAITLMGLGSWSCILYTSLCAMARQGLAGAKNEKGEYLIAYATGLRGKQERLAGHQPELTPEDTAQSRLAYSRWMKLAWADVSIGTFGNLFTTAILCFLALAMLHNSKQIPSASWDLLSAQAEFFRPVLGSIALPVFLVLGGAFLIDTWIGFGSLLSGLMTDTLPKLSNRFSKVTVNRLFYSCFAVFVLQSAITVTLQPPGNLIRITALCLNVSTPFLCVLLFYLNYVYLPKVLPRWVRPNPVSALCLAVSFVCYSALAIWYLTRLF